MTDLMKQLGILTPDEMQECFDIEKPTVRKMLDDLKANKYVSRWDIFSKRIEIRKIMYNNSDYDDIRDEVDFLIESARESL